MAQSLCVLEIIQAVLVGSLSNRTQHRYLRDIDVKLPIRPMQLPKHFGTETMFYDGDGYLAH